MEAKTLPFSSLNDIVFEGRNKAYGAYALRKAYNRELVKAASISFTSVLFLFWGFYVSGQLSSGYYPNITKPPATNKVNKITIEPLIPKPLIAEMVKPAPAIVEPVAPTTTVATKKFREIKIVTNETPVTNYIPSQTNFELAEPGLNNVAGDIPGTGISTEAEITEAGGTSTFGEETTPFVVVEQMPEFPDGLAAMYKFINKHLRYPAQAQAHGLEGAVILSFVVSATGKISDIEIIKDIGGGAGEEAKRVIRKMPAWQPGKQNKQAVPVRFTLPIRFKLD